jgi:hypothetical protein
MRFYNVDLNHQVAAVFKSKLAFEEREREQNKPI